MKPDTIYCGDACEIMAKWPEGAVNLAFADPPYNIGYVYDKYNDNRPDDEYVGWCEQWMDACKRALTPDGSFFIAIGDDFAADVRILGRKLGLHLRNWIIWHYTFGQNMRAKFSRAHTHIFYFTKDPKCFTFNDKALRFPSARHTEYQDLRASPLGRLPDDVWDEFPRVCGTFKERDGFHGCQLPEAMLMRIVLAASNPGDVVLDPFVGSGTTAAAAKRLGRRYVGIDISEKYAQRTRERLRAVRDESNLPAGEKAWPELHTELLVQLYRETKVILDNLLPNEVALRVFAASLKQRCGAEYDVEALRGRLEALAAANQLPKLPNDRRFTPYNHVKSEGKRYERHTQRYRGRKPAGTTKQRLLHEAS